MPFVTGWGNKYLPIAHTFPEFLADAAAGTLPAVSFLDPKFQDEDQGTSGDDHPHADIRVGDAFLSQAFHAVASGPGWGKTVFGEVLLGIRVPTIVASPWTHGHETPRIHSHLFDHTSVLKLKVTRLTALGGKARTRLAPEDDRIYLRSS